MANILIIDTAVEVAGICLTQDGTLAGLAINREQKEQAGWLQPAILNLMNQASLQFSDLDAIAVAAGPGSYTGLRVGMASAKGLCYALSKPLIAINTLTIMANAASKLATPHQLICPMIDARRLEVYTAIFDQKLNLVLDPLALILEPNSYDPWLVDQELLFFGNGSEKFRKICKNHHALFPDIQLDVTNCIDLAQEMFENKAFSDLIYAEPYYLKPFYSPNITKL